MSSSRDDFGIAFRSALLQRGAAQKFSLISLIFVASILFFLDVFGFGFMKPVRSIINDGVYRVSMVASAPTRFIPNFSYTISDLFKLKNENKRLREEIEDYKLKEFKVEYLTNQNRVLEQFLELSDKKNYYSY